MSLACDTATPISFQDIILVDSHNKDKDYFQNTRTSHNHNMDLHTLDYRNLFLSFYPSSFADAGQRPNILTDQYAEYILNFETLGSADFIPNRKTLSDNALPFLHVGLLIPLEW